MKQLLLFIDRLFGVKLPFKLALLCAFAFIFVLGLLMYYPNFQAQWYWQNDHGIFEFCGQDKKVTFSEIPNLLMQTEIGDFGKESLRYRPVFFFLRILQTFLLGLSPIAWYSCQFVVWMLCFISILLWAHHRYGILEALVLILSLHLYPFWGAIYSRLGPSEYYGVLGLTAYFIAYDALWHGKSPSLQEKFL